MNLHPCAYCGFSLAGKPDEQRFCNVICRELWRKEMGFPASYLSRKALYEAACGPRSEEHRRNIAKANTG